MGTNRLTHEPEERPTQRGGTGKLKPPTGKLKPQTNKLKPQTGKLKPPTAFSLLAGMNTSPRFL